MPHLKNCTTDDLRVVGLNDFGLRLIPAGESVEITAEQAKDPAYNVPGVYEIVPDTKAKDKQ